MRKISIAALTVISIAAAGILAQAQDEADFKELIPEGVNFEAVTSGGQVIYYKAYGQQGQLIGVVFKASGQGYSSTIETLAGMLKDGTITAIKILSQDETPALGGRVAEPDFTGQFKHTKDLSNIQAITGATISSRAVIDSVEKKAQEIKALIK
jgi:electron transport complex protein RnfG